MRGNISPVLVKLLQDQKGRQKIYQALTTGRAIVNLDEETFEIAVVGTTHESQSDIPPAHIAQHLQMQPR